LSYLETFPKDRIIVDANYPVDLIYPIKDHPNWKYFYPDAEEEFRIVLPTLKGPKVRMAVFVDADHVHDLVIIRSMTGILAI
jgi:hypothetical protein